MGNSVKCFAEIQVNNIQWSPHEDRRCYVVVEGVQVNLVQFTFGKFVLVFPNHLLQLESSTF